MLSENTPKELADLYRSCLEKKDADAVRHLEKEALHRLTDFLNETVSVDADDSVFWLTMIRAFSLSADVSLKMTAKQAEAKLLPLLKEFDADMGFDFSQQIDDAVLERNLTDLSVFETVSPFQRPDFRQIAKLIEKIDIENDDGTLYEKTTFTDDVLKAARVKTFLRLCLNLDKITDELYFFVLKRETESFLISLLLTETSEMASESATPEEIQNEFEKFLNAIE